MKRIAQLLLLLIPIGTFAQNLVPNPSFEDTVSCPTTANQINKAVGWHASRESPDYFNQCDFITGTTSVPNNFNGYQYAHTGVAYAGFITYGKTALNVREYFTCQLLNPLVIGLKYKISLYVSWAAGSTGNRIASNKIGTLFSTNNYTLTNLAPMQNYCQFKSDSIIVDSLYWFNIEGDFIADSSYTYLTIGNFFDDSNTDTLMLNNPSTYAYYFIDDISVIQDTSTNLVEQLSRNEITIYPNPTNNLLRINFGNSIVNEIQIISSTGILQNRDKFTKRATQTEYNLGDYKQGMYTIIIIGEKKNFKYKLIKIQ